MRRDVRSVPLALVVTGAVFLAARIGLQLYERSHPPVWADLVHWKTPTEAVEVLADENRPALYDFTASWCEGCQEMKQEVFANAQSAELVNDYIPIRVEDTDDSRAAREIRARYIVQALPTLLVTGPGLQQPLVLSGYPGADKTRAFLRESLRKASTSTHGIEVEVEKD